MRFSAILRIFRICDKQDNYNINHKIVKAYGHLDSMSQTSTSSYHFIYKKQNQPATASTINYQIKTKNVQT